MLVPEEAPAQWYFLVIDMNLQIQHFRRQRGQMASFGNGE
jgi:hypothetical protein